MQTALLGTYSNGVVELDEPIEETNGNKVIVVFLDKYEIRKERQKKTIDEMCGIFAGKVSFSASDDFARNKQMEKELEVF
ncbi:MAG: hypothetical protein FWC26_00730 [Fibromonadales bacterium]|nr:hypothetical protein [Fibromonadales bacterium]